jgi:Sec-independent protein translocase protein TatA
MIHYFYGAVILGMFGCIVWLKLVAKSTGKIKEYKKEIKNTKKELKDAEKKSKQYEKNAKKNINGSIAGYVASNRKGRRKKPT